MYMDMSADGFSQEEIQDARLERTADNLASRQKDIKPFDVDEFTGAATQDLDAELLAKQYELSHATDIRDRMRLEKEVMELAERAVRAEAEAQDIEMDDLQVASAAEELLGTYGSEEVNGTLEWAAGGLSDSVSAAINDVLAEDGLEAVGAFNAVKDLRSLPEGVIENSGGEVEAFELHVANELAETYGEAGEQIAAINAALVAGQCTRAEAAKIVASNPRMLMAAMSAARSGLIRLAL